MFPIKPLLIAKFDCTKPSKSEKHPIQNSNLEVSNLKINAPSYQRSKTFSSRANIFLAKLSIQKSFLVWSRSFGIKWNYFGPILGQDIEVLKTWWKWNNETEFEIKRGLTKGQLISEWLLDVSFEPKKEQKYFCISALPSKMGQITQKIAHYHAN